MEGTRKHHIKRNKPGAKGKYGMFSLMYGNLKYSTKNKIENSPIPSSLFCLSLPAWIGVELDRFELRMTLYS